MPIPVTRYECEYCHMQWQSWAECIDHEAKCNQRPESSFNVIAEGKRAWDGNEAARKERLRAKGK